MRFLAAALALLFMGVANAHLSIRELNYPEFPTGKTLTYDAWINITSGIPGMHPQSAKSALNLEIKVHATTKNELYLSIPKVRNSNSIPSVGSLTDPVSMETNQELEEHLRVPIKVTFEHGQVKSYSLDNHGNLEYKKIMKAVLRLFELQLDTKSLRSHGDLNEPLTYNLTRNTPVGNFSSHYIVTSSPYPDFPREHNVINITRTDNLEGIPYLTYHTHHNFEEQGCPGVCKKEHSENRFGAGCPAEWEPYQTPMKKSFVQQHNLRRVKGGVLIIDSVRTKETHIADIYDQMMEVTIHSYIRHTHTDKTPIPAPSKQRTYTDLHDWSIELRDREIYSQCNYTTTEQATETVKEILDHITHIIHKGSIDGEATNIGEKLVLLQKALSLLKHKDFIKIREDSIVSYGDISQASEEAKIKRQLWWDSLPLVGTEDAVYFIVDLIKKNINEKDRGVISLWESKNILEALPMNILKPNSKTIQVLSELPDALLKRSALGYGMYYSASSIALARVIRNMCAVSNGIPASERDSRANYLEMLVRDDFKKDGCPKIEVKKYMTDMAEKIKSNPDRLKRIIHIEALSQTGLVYAIPLLKPIVEGYIAEATPSYTDYVRSVAINALHNLVGKHSKLIKDIVFPIFINKTEPPKIRTTAFSVFIRSYPTLGDLQHVAEQTWHEPSLEVGSYVTSTLETFGNSSIPCDQLTARRIKKILPQIKRYSVGKHHAQNVLQTVFDEIRGLGIEHRFEFTPSNESFFPSTLYSSLGYNADSLRDVFFKWALNSQGFNSLNLWDNILRLISLKAASSIPKSKESEIFPEIEMADRANEFWRFTIFEKLFYSMSYYYMDDQEFQNGGIVELLLQHFKHYLKFDHHGNAEGHLVKMFLPSSFQSKTIAQTLPYPVQFEMRNPMLISAKIHIKRTGSGQEIDIRPSYYHSMLYTNRMMNLGDCKHVGVYHEKKMAAAYPIKITWALNNGKVELSYSFPEVPKKIFTYHSEAGTSASKHGLHVQPLSTERQTIKTIPEQFVRNVTFGVVGLPVFASSILTEDIHQGFEELPRNKEHAVYQFIKNFLNAGFRRKTVTVLRQLDDHAWGPKTEVKIRFGHHHEYVKTKEQEHKTDNSWMNSIGHEDDDDYTNYEPEERKVNDKMEKLSHVSDRLSLIVEHKVSDEVSNKARVEVVYKRTLEGTLHTFHCNATAKAHGISFGAVTKAAALFYNRPNEFKYGDDGYGKQKGIILGAIRFPGDSRPYIFSKVVLSYKPLDEHMNKELQKPVDAKYFYPETHDECLRDVQKGKSHSVACIKAIREHAMYNRVKALVIYKEIPRVVQHALDIIDLSVKHTYFHHLSIERRNSKLNAVHLELNYIDKLTDNPVVDVVIRKPTEVVRLHKVYTSFIQPMSSIYSLRDTYIQHYTNNTYPVTCTLMKENIRTYDLKTFHLQKFKSCSYVLSTHCVEHKKFAVIAKIDKDNLENKEIYIYIGEHSIHLKPGKEHEFEFDFDQKPHTVYYLQPVILDESEKIYAHIVSASVIEIIGEKTGVKVTYDGTHAKIQVAARYKGELCGLCSEFDGEVVREWRGPNRCLYSNVYDYQASCAVGSCYKSKGAHESICSDEDYERAAIQDEDEDETDRKKEYEPKVKRNEVHHRDDETCFSTEPVPKCDPQDLPIKTENKVVGFHCLPKNEVSTRKLEMESNRKPLREMGTKSVDFRKSVEYHTSCSRQ